MQRLTCRLLFLMQCHTDPLSYYCWGGLCYPGYILSQAYRPLSYFCIK